MLACALTSLCACQVHTHRIGAGPSGLGSDSLRQYYLLFGLVPVSEGDSQRLTQDSTSYEIVTKYSLVDMLLAPILAPLTMTSRTVQVNR